MLTKTLAAAFLAAAVAGCATAPADMTTPAKIADPGDPAVALQVTTLLDRGLTPASVEEIALVNNRRIVALYEELNISRAEVLQATLLKNPVLDAALKIPISGGATGAELSIIQDFLDILWVPLRLRMAQENFRVAKARITAAAHQLASQVIAAYHTAKTTDEVLVLQRQILQAAELSHEFAVRMRAAGSVTELELSHLAAAQEQAKLDFADAEASAAASREHLSGLLGVDNTQWKFAEAADDLAAEPEPTEKLESIALEKSFDLEILRRQSEAAITKRQLARPLGFLPDVKAGAVAEKDYGDGWAAGPSLSIEIPIFDQGQAKIASAEAELRRNKQELLATTKQIASEVRELRIRVIAARNKALHYKNVILPLREKITAGTQLENNGMLVSLFDLLSIKREEIEARMSYRFALRDYYLANAALNQLLAGSRPQTSTKGEN